MCINFIHEWRRLLVKRVEKLVNANFMLLRVDRDVWLGIHCLALSLCKPIQHLLGLIISCNYFLFEKSVKKVVIAIWHAIYESYLKFIVESNMVSVLCYALNAHYACCRIHILSKSN